MKIERLGPSETVVVLSEGREIFFSYDTSVAGKDKNGLFQTDKKWSSTTSKHIGKYLNGRWQTHPAGVRKVSQASIDLYVELL